MSQIDQLLEFVDKEIADQLKPKKDIPKEKTTSDNTSDSLLEIIDREVSRLFSLVEESSPEQPLDVETAYKSIPLPQLSEMGWADPSKKGGDLADGARKELSQYLAPIRNESKDLEDAVQNLQSFIDQRIDESDRDMPISDLLSFLVFYKILTHIIANFNKATAGFLFEALLGVLTGGGQIAAAGAGGGETIADFKYKTGKAGAGGERWVSLKLLTEEGTTVDGSFRDLIGDLSDPTKNHTMQYVVVLKNLEGGKDDLAGSLNFYSFYFTKDNIHEILNNSKQGSKDLQLADKAAREFLDSDFTVRPEHYRFFEWLVPYIEDQLPNEPEEQELIGKSVDKSVAVYYSQLKKYEKDLKKAKETDDSERSPKNRKHSFQPTMPKNEADASKHPYESRSSIYGWFRGRRWKAQGAEKDPLQVIFKPHLITTERSIFAEKYGSSKKKIKNPKSGAMVDNPEYEQTEEEELSSRKKMIKFNTSKTKDAEYKWLSPEDSYNLIKDLDEVEFWEYIRKYSFGYLRKQNFVVTQAHTKNISEHFGTLSVGKELIHNALTKMINGVNERVFRIYQEMDLLSNNLREFFMENMNYEKGKLAETNANNVASATEKLVKEQEEG